MSEWWNPASLGETPTDGALSGAMVSEEGVLADLNDRQREAVLHEDGPLLVLAGAGSGKTRVLTRRVAHLIGVRGTAASSVLAVTFTNKAAGQMRERIVSLVGDAGRRAWIGTFHSIGVRILRREAAHAGVHPDFSIFDRADQTTAVRRVLEAKGISPQEHKPESFLGVISRAKNDLVSPAEFLEKARGPWERLVADIYASYAESLTAQSALDFDDLLMRPVLLLRDEDIRLKYARRFRHVLVDEYQDTNRCQYEFLHALTRDHQNLFVVGDDDQSIYGWRGADLRNILDFERDYTDATTVRLEQNYRSTGTILDAANSVIRNNSARKGKELWTENGSGDRVLVLEVPDDQTEAMSILRMVKSAQAEGGHTAEDFAVLYRTNAQSRTLENTFRMGGVAYQVVGGQRFYERREIKDVLAYLRIVANPADDVALRRVVNVPARGVGKKTLEDLAAAATAAGTPLLAAIRMAVAQDGGAALRPGVRKKLAAFLEGLDRASCAGETPVGETTERLLEDIGYQAYLGKESEEEAQARWENVTELLAAMQEFTDEHEDGDATVAGFLREVSLATDVDDMEEETDRVTLMTLHTAKGLEFPCVFITGMEEGLFPHANSSEDAAGLEEERRLFYVGLTRAEQRVVLVTAGERMRFGGFHSSLPSRFLDEIDEKCVEGRKVRSERRGMGRGSSTPQRAWGGRRATGGATAPVRKRAPVGPVVRTPEPDYEPDYENENQDAGSSSFEKGMRVVHPHFGEAEVEAAEGRGENLKVTLRFPDGSRKKVLAAYAKLRPAEQTDDA